MESVLLPKSVRPIRYDLTLEPDLETFVFLGSETVEVEVAELTTEVVLHSVDLDIEKEILFTSKQGSVQFQATSVRYDTENQRAIIAFASPLPAGAGLLQMKFRGVLTDKLAGFYRSKYKVLKASLVVIAMLFSFCLLSLMAGTDIWLPHNSRPQTLAAHSPAGMSLPSRPDFASRSLCLPIALP